MKTLTVQHVTTYRYARPVRFGEHRLMFRPRDSHDMRLVATAMVITPTPAHVRWIYDVFGNCVAIADFEGEASELRLESDIKVEHYGDANPEFSIETFARNYPFSYAAEEVPDLGRTAERHYPDPEHKVDAWARQFVTPNAEGVIETQALLECMTHAIKGGFTYAARDEEGTQTPTRTLELRTGSCRDFALLMMEAARSLGFAARFVSGYLYDPAVDTGADGMVGAGATHAWVQIYLPGAGWIEFDPTNGLIGGTNLIRVAVTRDPTQAVPVAGQWTGAPTDFLGLSVGVTVTTRTDTALSGAVTAL